MELQNLTGTWYNQLGSKMTLTADKDGGLHGTYESAVGKASGTYLLVGRFDTSPPPDSFGVSVGWVVTFHNEKCNAHSTTAWSGQYFQSNKNGKETILTHWLLTSSTALKDVWKSTKVGHDTFTREKPSNLAEIVKAQALTADSTHPDDILSQFFHFN